MLHAMNRMLHTDIRIAICVMWRRGTVFSSHLYDDVRVWHHGLTIIESCCVQLSIVCQVEFWSCLLQIVSSNLKNKTITNWTVLVFIVVLVISICQNKHSNISLVFLRESWNYASKIYRFGKRYDWLTDWLTD